MTASLEALSKIIAASVRKTLADMRVDQEIRIAHPKAPRSDRADENFAAGALSARVMIAIEKLFPALAAAEKAQALLAANPNAPRPDDAQLHKTCQRCLKRHESTRDREMYLPGFQGPCADSFCYASCESSSCRPVHAHVCQPCAEQMAPAPASLRQITRKP